MSAEKFEALDKKLDAIQKAVEYRDGRKVPLKNISVSLLGVFGALLAFGAPTAAVVANHYKIQEHLVNTRVHAEEGRSERLGGIAYSGDLAQKERQLYFALKALHCGVVPNAALTICSSAYPDGPFPEFLAARPPVTK